MWTASDALYALCSRVVASGPVPKHVGFIMDGHRRYGRSKNMGVEWGYFYGTEITIDVCKWCFQLGIEEVTLFGFSIDNFGRPENEIKYVMDQTLRALKIMRSDPSVDGVKVQLMADLGQMPTYMRGPWADVVVHRTVHERGTCNIAFVYTSHEEMTSVARTTAAGVAAGTLNIEDVCEDLLNNCMYSYGSNPVDMIVRTSGEVRLSDFLLWQSSHACLYFTPVLWPDFTRWQVLKAVLYYQRWRKEQDLLLGAKQVLEDKDKVSVLSALRADVFARDLFLKRFERTTRACADYDSAAEVRS